jgi:hypothetical protein
MYHISSSENCVLKFTREQKISLVLPSRIRNYLCRSGSLHDYIHKQNMIKTLISTFLCYLHNFLSLKTDLRTLLRIRIRDPMLSLNFLSFRFLKFLFFVRSGIRDGEKSGSGINNWIHKTCNKAKRLGRKNLLFVGNLKVTGTEE